MFPIQGVLKPFCDLLAAKDGTLGVVLDGIANILATAEKLQETDKVAMMVEESGGLDRIEALQSHENEQIASKAQEIIGKFFPHPDLMFYFLFFKHTVLIFVKFNELIYVNFSYRK